MKLRESNLYRAAMLAQFGATDIFASYAGVSVSTVNRILRGESPFNPNRRRHWEELLGISRRENSAVILVDFPVEAAKVEAFKLKPGPGGLGT